MHHYVIGHLELFKYRHLKVTIIIIIIIINWFQFILPSAEVPQGNQELLCTSQHLY